MRQRLRRKPWLPPQLATPFEGNRAHAAITVTRVGVVIGADFLPDREVTVRITRLGRASATTSLTHRTATATFMTKLPARPSAAILQIAATDSAPRRMANAGRIWS